MPAQGLDVRLGRELIERARAEGVSLTGEDGPLASITRQVLQAALEAEMSDHLGYEKGEPGGAGSGNHRNGTSRKRVLTEIGAVELAVPRDLAGTFEPQIVPKHSRRSVSPTQAGRAPAGAGRVGRHDRLDRGA